jgi:hypothetical protein
MLEKIGPMREIKILTIRARPPRNCPNHPGVSCYYMGIGREKRIASDIHYLAYNYVPALVGVFIEISFVTNFAFWVLFGAYILFVGGRPAQGAVV